MNQQINLYQPMFRRQEKVFSALTMLQTISLFLVVLGIIYFYGQYQLKPLQEQVRKLSRDTASLQAQVSKYRKQAPPANRSKLLGNEIARLQQELDQRRRIRDILAHREIGNSTGFSGYMEALARQHVQGTWLTGVEIDNGGKSLSLHGKTLASELVPRYIQRLGSEQILAGISFNAMDLERPPEQKAQLIAGNVPLNFKISTR